MSVSPEATLRQKVSEIAASLAEDLLPREGEGGVKGSLLSRSETKAAGEGEFTEDQKLQTLMRERKIEALRKEIRMRAERFLREALG